MYRLISRAFSCGLVAAALVLPLLTGCVTTNRVPYDPCARQTYRGSKPAGQVIVGCSLLAIPFRATVVDAETGAALPAVVVLKGQNVIDEPIADGSALGWSSPDGEVDLVVDSFVYTANPYTVCFRQSFPGILIEFQQDGYERYRCRVPLPERKGLEVDLGTVGLEPIEGPAVEVVQEERLRQVQ